MRDYSSDGRGCNHAEDHNDRDLGAVESRRRGPCAVYDSNTLVLIIDLYLLDIWSFSLALHSKA